MREISDANAASSRANVTSSNRIRCPRRQFRAHSAIAKAGRSHILGPELGADLLARDQLARPFQQHSQNLKRLVLQLDANAQLAQLAAIQVCLEWAEADHTRSLGGFLHVGASLPPFGDILIHHFVDFRVSSSNTKSRLWQARYCDISVVRGDDLDVTCDMCWLRHLITTLDFRVARQRSRTSKFRTFVTIT